MSKKLKVVVAGRSERMLKPLVDALVDAPGIYCSTHLISDGSANPLSGLDPLPDVLVLRFDADSRSELAALADSSPDGRPPLIMVGPAGNAETVRLAVRSGARDFLAEPVNPAELVAAIERLRDAHLLGPPGSVRGDLIAVLGAAGGVGASMLACNLAIALARETDAPTLLVDLDINAAPLANLLDLAPERGLLSAMSEVESLDAQALQGYTVKHHSGLRLLGSPSKSVASMRDVDLTRFSTFMDVLASNYRYIVADASHSLDDLSVATIGMAWKVVLVLEQSVVQVKQASRLLTLLCGELGVRRDRILVVINRYAKHSTVALDDVRRALHHEHVTVLPSHYKSVLASIDSGIPLIEYDESSSVSRGIVELQREIVSGHHAERAGLLRRALPIFSGE